MASPNPPGDRVKVASKLPAVLRQELKIRAAELALDIQDAVTNAITEWQELPGALPPVDTTGADSYSTYLPDGLYEAFKTTCSDRGVSYVQGLAQSVRRWLDTHPSPNGRPAPRAPRRLIVCNQKGGVGKTAIASGVAQALAEAGQRVLLVDFDPQGHLTHQLGIDVIPPGEDSLVSHMAGEGKNDLRDVVVEIEGAPFGKRLHLLPSCFDGFVLSEKMAILSLTSRASKEAALERALAPLEADYDAIVVDCLPSLGTVMDAALYYGRRREGEPARRSGTFIPVLAEDTSATAYTMLVDQITDLCSDLALVVEYLGLVVNMYDSRRGVVATSSLQGWKDIGDPPVVAIINDLKEQREAVRLMKPLLAYAPHCAQSEAMRQIAGGVL